VIDPGLLADSARSWGTPLYVTDLDIAAAHVADWRGAFPGALIAYAVKANNDPQLLRRLVAEGAGCEVVTAVELALARRAGCPPRRIVMNGVGKRDEELHLALEALGVDAGDDVIVKGTDLVAATHGRSFWILDDLSPVHQMQPATETEAVVLFQPRDTVRFRHYGRAFGSTPGITNYKMTGPTTVASSVGSPDFSRATCISSLVVKRSTTVWCTKTR